MKKVVIVLLTITLAFSFTACTTKATNTNNQDTDKNQDSNKNEDTDKVGSENLEGSLEDILKKIYDTAATSEQFKEYADTGLQKTEITAERTEYYLGKAGIEFEEALSSEPIMSPSAYELDLVRVKEGADIESIKKEMKDNVNPMKWVCVGVDPENIIVDNIGDVIILIMSDDEGKALHDAFLALKDK